MAILLFVRANDSYTYLNFYYYYYYYYYYHHYHDQ